MKRRAEQRVQIKHDLVEQRAQTEREISIDREQENVLQAYLDKITELMIARKLHTLEDKDFWAVATTRTLTALSKLDGIRKATLLKFLYKTDLINNNEKRIEVPQDFPSQSSLGDLEKQPTSPKFNFKNIRTLLTEGFTDEELRRLCYDELQFRPVYYQLGSEMGKGGVIDRLIEYTEQKNWFFQSFRRSP